jgi:SAM-dependent methyltransferase
MEERERIKPLVPAFPQDLIQGLSLFIPLANHDLVVLDLASGKGEVLEELQARGYKSVGIESQEENCRLSKEKGFKVICDSCTNLASLSLPKDIGAIWAGRAFEKIELNVIESLLNISHLIMPDAAPLFFSIPKQREIAGSNTTYIKEYLKLFLANQGFTILNEWTEAGPNGASWWSVIAISKGKLSTDELPNLGSKT